jgi:hypothetical protein
MNQKAKTEKTFCPRGLLPAQFSVGRLRAFLGIVLPVPFCFKLKQFLVNKVIKLA